MSDVGPDPSLAQQKARLDIATQAQKITQFKYDLLQHKVTRERTMKNMEACQTALDEAAERLDGLIEAHGEIELDNLF